MPPIAESSLPRKDSVDGLTMQEFIEEEAAACDDDLNYFETIENVVHKPKCSKVGKSKTKAATRKSNRKPPKTEYNECSD